jgi:hypothetical protein
VGTVLGVAWRATVVVALTLLAAMAASAPAAPLPDHRGYELVSPAQKSGGDVRTASSRTQVAADGNAVVFPSYVGFGEVAGTQVDTEYLAQRAGTPGTSGWVTRGITPRQEPLSFQATSSGVVSNFEAVFTPDLSRGVYRAWRPLTDAPNVADVTNLYRLDGLRGGATTATLVSDASAPISSPFFFLLLLFNPVAVGASSDLEHIVFESRWQLTADAPPFSVKLYEFTDGGVRLVGIQPDGTPTASAQATIGDTARDFYPIPHAVSNDGSHVFFTDVTTGDGSSSGTVYVRIDGRTTVQLNESEKTSREAAAPATLWGASADGTRAFFIANEGLVNGDDDALPDLYMYDEDAPVGARLTLLSADAEPFVKAVVGVSDDGHYVYFVADGQLPNGLYLWHDGVVSLIGAFGDTGNVVLNGPGAQYSFSSQGQRSRVTPDGRHVLFMSTSDLFLRGFGGFSGYDHAGHQELYVYSADTGRLACASCNPTGAPPTDDASPFVIRGWGAVTWHLSHALSDDGRWVFFNTPDALVSNDVNGRFDAYEYDTADSTLHLLSSGTEPTDSYFLDASPSGNDVFIATRERLVGWDVDTAYDVYDARVNGGFPEPPPVAPECVGEGCQGQPASAPAVSNTASSAFRGSGNATRRLKPRHRAKLRRCSGRSGVTRGKKRAGKCRHKRARSGRRMPVVAQRRGK